MKTRGPIGLAFGAALGIGVIAPVSATAVIHSTGVVQNAFGNPLQCAVSNTDAAAVALAAVQIKNAAGAVVKVATNVVIGPMATWTLTHYGISDQYRCEVDFSSHGDARAVVVRFYSTVSGRSYDGDKAVPVAVVKPAAQPVNICAVLNAFGGANQLIHTVPPDRRLVIEYTTLNAVQSMDPDELAQVSIRTVANGVEGSFLVGRLDGSIFTFVQDGRQVSIHADPDTDILGGVGTRNYTGSLNLCLSGKLIPDE